MNQAALAVETGDPLMTSEVVVAMLKQLRAMDTYDSYEGWSAEKIIDPVIVTKERKREIPIVGDPDEITLSRVKAYYNSVATLIEKQCGLLAVPVINLSHEGFGRALVLVGKLVVVDKILRDVHRWGFLSLEDMVEKTEQTVTNALKLIDKYHDVVEA